MAGPWEQYQTQPAASGPWTRYQTPAAPAAPSAGVDLSRAPVVDDVTWFRQTYGRDPISADQAGTNDPAAFRRTFGFDPVGPQSPNGVLGEDPYALRAQQDPEGHAAYQAQLQQGMPRTTTAGWDEQGFDTNNSPVDWIRQAGQGVFGLGDEFEGALGGLGSFFRGQGFQPGYDRSVTNARGEITEFENANPTTATLLEIAGALPTAAVPGMAAAARGATTLSRVGRGILAGTATGGLTGFGLGEGSPAERLPSTIQGAGPGGVVGGLLPLAAPAVSRLLTGRQGGSALAGIIPESADATAQRSILARNTTAEDWRQTGQAAYRQADEAGVAVAPRAYNDFVQGIEEAVRGVDGAVLHQRLTPSSWAVYEELYNLAGQSQYSIRDLDTIRRLANAAAISMDRTDARTGRIIRDQLDEWFATLKPADILAGDAAGAAAALGEARNAWGRYRRMELIDQLEENARDAVGANYTQAGMQTALRQQFRALKRSRQYLTFSPEERAAIDEIVRGTPSENALRRIGVLAPRGFFSSAFALSGVTMGEPLMLGASAIGEVARRASGAMANNSLRRLRSTVSGSGGVLPPSFGTQQAVQGVLGAGNAFLTPRLTLIPEEYLPVPAGLR